MSLDDLPQDRTATREECAHQEPRRVDLWYVHTEAADVPELLEEYRSLLPPDEAGQEHRFVFRKDRVLYLVTRALVRTTLSSYVQCEPRDWVFIRNAYGKPSVVAPPGFPLQFNLSNTAGLVVCAVAPFRDVGVDVENTRRERVDLALAGRYFASMEVAFLQKAPPDRRREVFYRFWTLKEAYIKARGMGLSIPLDEFAFSLNENGPPRIRFAPGVPDDPHDWQFGQFQLAAHFQIGLAIRDPSRERLRVRVIDTIPLRGAGRETMLPHSVDNEWRL